MLCGLGVQQCAMNNAQCNNLEDNLDLFETGVNENTEIVEFLQFVKLAQVT